jgi:hypothetical protein
MKKGANLTMALLIGDISYAGVSGGKDGEELSEGESISKERMKRKRESVCVCVFYFSFF